MSLIDKKTTYEVLTDYYHHTTDIQHKALREALDRVPSESDKDINVPNTDCISRKKTLERLTNISYNLCKTQAEDKIIEYAKTMVITMPSAQPKTQLSEEGATKDATSDCISRAEAIRIASGYCHPANIAKELAKLPSAQSDKDIYVPNTDTISRAAAIEGIRELFSMGEDYCDESSIVWMLNGLPTAEPHSINLNQGQSSDLISRQAAIDALDKRFDSIPMEQTTEILNLRKDLRELPSAEPSSSSEIPNSSDVISRQAAINEFKCCELTPDGGIDANYAVEFLEQLPSVQPELDESVYRLYKRAYEAGQRNAQAKIIKCGECIKQDLCAWYRDGAKFCSYGERRTDG